MKVRFSQVRTEQSLFISCNYGLSLKVFIRSESHGHQKKIG
jgi:hypothetical protein